MRGVLSRLLEEEKTSARSFAEQVDEEFRGGTAKVEYARRGAAVRHEARLVVYLSAPDYMSLMRHIRARNASLYS